MARALVIPVMMIVHRCRQVVLTRCSQWQIKISVTLTYDTQGGVGEPGDQSGDSAGSDVTVSSTVPARDGYVYWLEHPQLMARALVIPVVIVHVAVKWF